MESVTEEAPGNVIKHGSGMQWPWTAMAGTPVMLFAAKHEAVRTTDLRCRQHWCRWRLLDTRRRLDHTHHYAFMTALVRSFDASMASYDASDL